MMKNKPQISKILINTEKCDADDQCLPQVDTNKIENLSVPFLLLLWTILFFLFQESHAYGLTSKDQKHFLFRIPQLLYVLGF